MDRISPKMDSTPESFFITLLGKRDTFPLPQPPYITVSLPSKKLVGNTKVTYHCGWLKAIVLPEGGYTCKLCNNNFRMKAHMPITFTFMGLQDLMAVVIVLPSSSEGRLPSYMCTSTIALHTGFDLQRKDRIHKRNISILPK